VSKVGVDSEIVQEQNRDGLVVHLPVFDAKGCIPKQPIIT
jgi:hypothetical protein